MNYDIKFLAWAENISNKENRFLGALGLTMLLLYTLARSLVVLGSFFLIVYIGCSLYLSHEVTTPLIALGIYFSVGWLFFIGRTSTLFELTYLDLNFKDTRYLGPHYERSILNFLAYIVSFYTVLWPYTFIKTLDFASKIFKADNKFLTEHLVRRDFIEQVNTGKSFQEICRKRYMSLDEGVYLFKHQFQSLEALLRKQPEDELIEKFIDKDIYKYLTKLRSERGY